MWRAGQWVMAVGVAAPAVSLAWPVLLFSALCVGGTFVFVTMAAMQQATVLAGADAGRWMAAMTAAFALGQWLGPLTVGWGLRADGTPMGASLLAAALLLASAWALPSGARAAA